MSWYLIDGQWRHGPWWKRWVNRCLRWVQPSDWRWKVVVYSRCEPRASGHPEVIGYGVGWVEHLPS